MEQKFFKFEEALEKLGISAEKLNELRERGELRAYRDGSSWKFRGDEIERLVTDGIPDPPPPSDIGLIDPEELVAAEPLKADEESGLDLADDTQISSGPPASTPHDDSELEADLGDTDALSAGSELELEELEDTVTAGTSDLALDSLEPSSDPSDSILLSEEELGESVGPHASTIIGKSELESGEGDLELASDDDIHSEGSDVKLASPGASDVLSSQIAGSGILEVPSDKDSEDSGSGDAAAFEDLEELEIDLAAESSRVLSPEEVGQAKAAVGKEADAPEGDSDLALDELELADDDSNMGSTDVPMLEAEGEEVKDEGSGSEIDLASDADLLSPDGSGSDITLDSGDSGINLVSPSDSGLALDDIPLDIGGSAILSSLSLGGDSDPEISLIGSDSDKSQEADELQADDDFQLTPLSESGQEGDGDSSSQVIALDADIEELGEAALGEFDAGDLTEEADDAVVLSDDFGAEPAGELDMGFAPAGASAAMLEVPYSLWNILALGGVTLLLMLCGIMMLDMVRNIWSWGESFSVSSALLDALLGIFGLK